jgi:DNA-binding MarR family transcriptional regulator
LFEDIIIKWFNLKKPLLIPKYMDDEVVLSKKMLKAIGSETRVKILKALKSRQKTQSELAKELNLKPSTILEHVEKLHSVELIEINPDYAEKKWKYFRLTKSGRKIIEGQKMSIIMMLSHISAAITVSLLVLSLATPWIISLLIGGPIPPEPTTPPITGGGTEPGQIANAMTSLENDSRSIFAMGIMVFFFITLILYSIAHFLKSRSKH